MAVTEDLPVRIRQGEGFGYDAIRSIAVGKKSRDSSGVGENTKQGRRVMKFMKAAKEHRASDQVAPVLTDK